MSRRIDAAVVATTAVAAVTAALGCVLPWERLAVRVSDATTPLGAPHGTGIAACAGGIVALLALAHLARWPGPAALRDAAFALAATLLILGAALFTWRGGYAPGSGDGYTVSIAPGLPLAGAAGLLLLLSRVAAAVWRRGG